MSKNFLLSKPSALILAAVVHSLVGPAWSVEVEDEDAIKRSRTLPTLMNENNNEDGNINSAQQVDGFQSLPIRFKAYILEIAAFDVGADKKNLSNFALVCKDWNQNLVKKENNNIKHKIKKAWLRGLYNITDPQDIATLDRFYEGALIYRPMEGSDEGMIRLPISDLRNPLAGTFNLSSCGDTGQYLSINTGYRKVQTPANANMVEIWFMPRFLADKKMSQLAPNHHIRGVISENWDAARAPIGIFWTWGGWNAAEQIGYCDYLTEESMEEVRSENLFKKYRESCRLPGARYGAHTVMTRAHARKISYFVCELK